MSKSPKKSVASQVEIAIKCRDLKNKDMISKSDPFVVVYQKGVDGNWKEIGRTEEVKDNLSPEFMERIVVKYLFEEKPFLRFEVFDSDGKKKKDSESPGAKNSLGFVQVQLNNLISLGGFKASLEKGKGEIILYLGEISNNPLSHGKLFIECSAMKLANKDTFGKSDPFFVINKSISQDEFLRVYESEFIKNDLNPIWKPCSISLQEICSGQVNRLVRIDVYDFSANGKHDYIGSFNTSVREMTLRNSFAIIDPKREDSKKYTNSGIFKIDKISIDSQHSFLDYVQSGLALNFGMAIDFSSANGELHKKGGKGDNNEYTAAIKTMGNIIEDYDSDKKVLAYGFGAKLPSGKLSQDFHLNIESDNPFCEGVSGLISAYNHAVGNVKPASPNNIIPVIEKMAGIAKSHQDGSNYYILTIVTNGDIASIEDTKAAIVEATNLPMSIIILGVGSKNFETMEALDCDKGILTTKTGVKASRDIVQFVDMKKYVKIEESGDIYWDRPGLAKNVLAEIPKQVTSWMSKNNIKPKK